MTEFTKDDFIKWMKLTKVKGLGPSRIKKLFKMLGNLDEVYASSDSNLIQTRIFNQTMVEDFRKLKEASDENFAKVIDDCNEKSIEIIPLQSEKYPESLKEIPASPLTLFMWGDRSILDKKKFAVAGTREPAEQTRKFAYDSAKELGEREFVVISGGALGVDAQAHRGSLDSKIRSTICILPSGFNRPYPPENAELFTEIKTKGLLISEHLPNFPGSQFSLINRNRIISGLSKGILLVASKKTGGTMVQADLAYKQRVPMFCPRIDLGLQPNEGMKIAIEKFGATEITDVNEMLSKLEKLGKKISDF